MANGPDPAVDINAIIEDGSLIDEALRLAVRDTLLDHKRSGDPIVVWQNGRVVWIPADQIVIDDDADARAAPSPG